MREYYEAKAQHEWVDRQVADEFTNELCQHYQTAPIATLQSPDPNLQCFHVWSVRKMNKTLENYQDDAAAMRWRLYQTNLATGAIVTVVVSALVYCLGWAIGWILKD